MAYPEDINTRQVSAGGAYVLESGEEATIELMITSTKSLIRADTGDRFEKGRIRSSGTGGSAALATLPTTEQSGWIDAETGLLIDVSAAGSYTHRYMAQLLVKDQAGTTLLSKIIGPFVLPAGEGTVDLDVTLPVSSTPGDQVFVPDMWSQFAPEAAASALAAQQARDAAQGAASVAEGAADEAEQSATSASTDATSASDSASSALTSATQSEAARAAAVLARTGAEAARDLALAGQFAGAELGTADLDTITTPGAYRVANAANATLARHYPQAGVGGAVFVYPSGVAGVVRQEFIPIWNGTNSAVGKVTFSRNRFGDGTWSTWTAYSAQRVDQTAGRAIYTWDDLNNREQLIYGDTGWRRLVAWGASGAITEGTLGEGWAPRLGQAGDIRIRRIGSTVTVAVTNLATGATSTPTTAIVFLPVGFQVSAVERRLIDIWSQSGVSALSSFSIGSTLARGGNSPWLPNHYSIQNVVTSITDQPWPTTLPGVAAGGIPNV